jgi:hypothetical protein
MTASGATVTAASLRGSLPSDSLDARAVVRLAKNTRCQRLAALTLVGSSPGKAMDHIFAPGFLEEQSRFSLLKGNRFETVQTDNGAARLLASLQDAGVTGPTDLAVRDLKDETSGIANKKAAMQRAMALTDDILRCKAAGDPSAPNVVLQAALGIPLGSGELACVRPDILVARQGEPMYRPGDMKSYAFVHHLTEQQDVGQAAAQIGVYGMALERRLQHLGIQLQIPTDGVIVMVRPGGLQSVAKLQNIERDISTARRIIDSDRARWRKWPPRSARGRRWTTRRRSSGCGLATAADAGPSAPCTTSAVARLQRRAIPPSWATTQKRCSPPPAARSLGRPSCERFATSWLPVPQAMSRIDGRLGKVRCAMNVTSSGSTVFSRKG